MSENNLTNKKNDNSDARGKNPLVITVFISIAVMLIVTAVSFYFYIYTKNSLNDESKIQGNVEYSQYYALICDDNEFNRQVYEAAKAKGDELGICVDMLSRRINHDYSTEELFEIALASNVDGIIVEASDAPKMKTLIDTAGERGIDVVTLLSDRPDSTRISSVQVGAYNLGKIYGQQVISKPLKGSELILVLNDSSRPDATQNLIFSGVQDMINGEIGTDTSIQINSYSVDGSDTFVMEEMIRSLFIDEELTPDVIICPDDQETKVVYQALVDYNKVGMVRLIGYHDSQTVLSGIRQGVIEATIAVDVDELGEYAVEALSEYKSTGFASEYYSVNSKLIDINNISSYYVDISNE